ncbi:MAG: ASKHA domain-containing protein, partial [Coriobacteriales bacterium]|nr:ASKHA domain-containing protein [Coriobacteriales bacterium]
GLYPQALLAVARGVGNTAIEGISAALASRAATQELLEVAQLCDYTELSTNPRFNACFMEALLFEEV